MDTELLIKEIDKLNNEKHNLIIRIASLSDSVLLEQAKEDYEIIEEKIIKITSILENNLYANEVPKCIIDSRII